jgi:hypothetical protein
MVFSKLVFDVCYRAFPFEYAQLCAADRACFAPYVDGMYYTVCPI